MPKGTFQIDALTAGGIVAAAGVLGDIGQVQEYFARNAGVGGPFAAATARWVTAIAPLAFSALANACVAVSCACCAVWAVAASVGGDCAASGAAAAICGAPAFPPVIAVSFFSSASIWASHARHLRLCLLQLGLK
jgi:hypothetical protein